MQLEHIAANVRMRSSWEAIDLGFAMVRAWWLAIYPPLAIVLVVLTTALSLIIPYEYYWVTLLLLWWLKPLYHRLILTIISRRLFGESLSLLATLKTLPHLMFKTGLLSELTWRRFSFSRGFILPVWQLENLRGGARKNRQKALLNNVHSDAVWLTIAIVCFQFILIISSFVLIWLLIPSQFTDNLYERLLSNQLDGILYSTDLIFILFFVTVMGFLEPFYIGASFALYINRRTQLEAWDIELDFRKMSQRMKAADKKLGVAPAIFLMLGLTFALSNHRVEAEEIPDSFVAEQRLEAKESKRIITEVMQSEGLSREKVVMGWRYIDNDEDEAIDNAEPLTFLSEIIAKIVEFSLWLLVAAAIITLYIFRKQWLPLLHIKQSVEPAETPDILFGMDVRSDSLPDDVIASASRLWQMGQARNALSLLYRSALVQLINQERLALKQSHTEGDILRLSQTELHKTRQDYFKRLTKNWVQIAYAHELPSQSEMEYLLEQWELDFATTSSEQAS